MISHAMLHNTFLEINELAAEDEGGLRFEEWKAAMTPVLARLSHELRSHFEEEETSGVLAKALEQKRSAAEVRKLKFEHDEFLEAVSKLISEFNSLESRNERAAALHQHFRALGERLLRHEMTEDDIAKHLHG